MGGRRWSLFPGGGSGGWGDGGRCAGASGSRRIGWWRLSVGGEAAEHEGDGDEGRPPRLGGGGHDEVLGSLAGA